MRRALALLFVAFFVGFASPARAATTSSSTAAPDAVKTPTFTLLQQPAWVHEGSALPLRLRIAHAQRGLVVRVALHSAVHSRLGFEQTASGDSLGGVIDTASSPLDDVTTGTKVTTVHLGMPDSNVPAEDILHIGSTGVYPLSVELRSGAVVIDQFVTWVVFVSGGNSAGAVPEPLRFTWVWSVVAPPAHDPDGTPNGAVLSQMQPKGRLEKIAGLLDFAQHYDIPLTLALSPETLQSWLALADDRKALRTGANEVRDAASNPSNDLLQEPYVPIDLPAFENSGLGRYFSDELVAGADTLYDLTGIHPDAYTHFVDPVDTHALARLHESLASQVLVRDAALQPKESNLTPARPFKLAGTDAFIAASANSTVESWLGGEQSAAVRSQRFLAGLSLIALEAPSNARGIVAAMPPDWSPDTAVVERVIGGLRRNPLVRTVGLTRYFRELPLDTNSDGSTVTRELAPSTPGTAPVTPSAYANAQRSLSSFRALVGESSPSVVRGERALGVALSTTLSPAEAQAYLDVITSDASAFLDRITTTQQRVTLTARRALIPIAFRNGTGQRVRVRVTLASPSGKALFPDGAQRVITLAPGTQTVRFMVEARATGTFAMLVSLSSEDGQLPIGAPTQITVRSTVFSGWGAALTIGALVFLAGWWGNHIWRTRRANRRAANAPIATA